MAAIVERDHATAIGDESLNPASIDPVDLLGRAEAMNQNDRIALALIEIVDQDRTVAERRHVDPQLLKALG